MFCHAASLEEEFSAIQSKSFSKDEECDAEALLEETVERVPTSEEVCFTHFKDGEKSISFLIIFLELFREMNYVSCISAIYIGSRKWIITE